MQLTIENFINKIEEEFEEIKPGTLTPNSDFREAFNWNSMNALMIMAIITSEFEVVIGPDDLKSCDTVQSLFDTVLSKLDS